MAIDRKPSMYPERDSVGSAEELEAYGVWVKSEPQDLVAGLAEAVNFNAEAMPFQHDFDTGFGHLDMPNAGLVEEIDVPDYETGGFDTEADVNMEQNTEEVSTQLLMKITDELSSIRSELSTLKKEFAGLRDESVPAVKTETPHDDFFDGTAGEKNTLTNNEMDNILSSSGFSEDGASFDPRRAADEAALKELSEQNEGIEVPEEIEIDFDSLGGDFEIPAEEEAAPELTENIPSVNEGLNEDIPPLEPAPDESAYLEGDPFIQDNAGLEDTAIDAMALDESFLSENILNESALNENIFEDTVSGDSALELGLDNTDLDFDVDVFSDKDRASIEEAFSDDPSFDLTVPEISEAIIDQSLVEKLPAEDAVQDDISFDDDFSLEIHDDFGTIDFDTKEEIDDAFDQVIPEGFELNADEAPISLDDDLEAFTEDEVVQLDPAPAPVQPAVVPAVEEPVADKASDVPVNLKTDLKGVLSYMDHLLESLPEDKIEEFAKSEYFDSYRKIFKELGLV